MAVPYIKLDRNEYKQLFCQILSDDNFFDIRFLPDSEHFLSLSNSNYLAKFSIGSLSEEVRFCVDGIHANEHPIYIRDYIYVCNQGDSYVVVLDEGSSLYIFDSDTGVCLAKTDKIFGKRKTSLTSYSARNLSMSSYGKYVGIFIGSKKQPFLVDLEKRDLVPIAPLKHMIYKGMYLIDDRTAFLIRKQYGGLDICDLFDGRILQHIDIVASINCIVADGDTGRYYVGTSNGIFEIIESGCGGRNNGSRNFLINRYMRPVSGCSTGNVVLCRNDSGVRFIAGMCKTKAYVYSIDGQALDLILIMESMSGTINWSISPDFSRLVVLTAGKNYEGSIMHVARTGDLLATGTRA
jgi:hypothetical protein